MKFRYIGSMKNRFRFLLVGMVALMGVLALNQKACAGGHPVTPAMAGHWEGNAHIIVNWTKATNLVVSLDIATDGIVTGKIGDATLKKGRFKSNRGWLGRKLNLATDHIITGDLEGPVIAAEGITRSGVNIPLTFTNGCFKGSVHTTGWEIGGKKHMRLTAGLKQLTKTEEP